MDYSDSSPFPREKTGPRRWIRRPLPLLPPPPPLPGQMRRRTGRRKSRSLRPNPQPGDRRSGSRCKGASTACPPGKQRELQWRDTQSQDCSPLLPEQQKQDCYCSFPKRNLTPSSNIGFPPNGTGLDSPCTPPRRTCTADRSLPDPVPFLL